MFTLHPAFALSSTPLTRLGLCELRLHSDIRWPWLILIPRVANARELEDLAPHQGLALLREINLAGVAVRAIGKATGREVRKLNVGILGNITPQLHVHVVGRHPDDPAWPGPVWGHGLAEAPASAELQVIRRAALEGLKKAPS